MAKRIELNPLTDTPASKSDLTKKFMLGYIKAHGTAEDKAWFKAEVDSATTTTKNNLTGKEVKTVELKKLRSAFVERFFPHLKPKASASAWFEEVESL